MVGCGEGVGLRCGESLKERCGGLANSWLTVPAPFGSRFLLPSARRTRGLPAVKIERQDAATRDTALIVSAPATVKHPFRLAEKRGKIGQSGTQGLQSRSAP